MTPVPNRVDELKKRYEENPRRFFAPLANEYRKAGDLEAAIDLCRMHLEEQPGHLSGHIVYGQALFESSQLADSKRVFEAALTLDPENLIALRHLGDIAKADGDATTARHWYGRVLEADPRNDEVTALIDSLGQLATAPSVIVAEQHAPPPSPDYALEIESAPAAADAASLTPVIPMSTVPSVSAAPAAPAAAPVPPVPPAPPAPPAPAAPRLSIGLMDLDLNLADSTSPTIDLLGAVGEPLGAAPVASSEAQAPPALEMVPPIEPAPPTVLEAAPAIDAGFTLADSGETAPSIEGSAIPGAEEPALSATSPAGGELEVQDTSFDLPPATDAPMFGAAHEPASFGDSLDVTATGDAEDVTPPRISLTDSIPLIDAGDTVPIGESVTDPKPITRHEAEPAAPAPATPAPATPADFDALFGNAPIADVTIGGESGTTAAAETGFVADSFVGREPKDELLETAPDIATPPSPFVTETMAELYLQQGFRDEALEVYRQLLVQNPDDKGLAERVKHLEHGTRSSLAIDSVSEEIEAHVKEEEIRRSGSIPTVPAAPVESSKDREPIIEAPTGPTPIIEMIPEPAAAVPAVSRAMSPTPVVPITPVVVESEPEMEMVGEEPPAPEAPIVAVVGATARELFARIAQRRAVPGGGAAAQAVASAPITSSAPDTMPAGAAPVAPAAEPAFAPVMAVATPAPEVPVAPGGSLDRLFGMSGISAVDEGAALAMAAAYGGVPAAPIKGEPARRVTDELSLDSVFKGEDGSGNPLGVQRQSTRLRFDQFFAGNEGGEPAPPPPSAAAPVDDIAQFTDWLKGLKGT